MKKIRLLALDIDDTLIPFGYGLSERTKAAIHAAQSAGTAVTIATGRPFASTKPVSDLLLLQHPLITFGGAQIVDPKDGRLLQDYPMDETLVSKVLETANELNTYAHIYRDGGILATMSDEKGKSYCKKSGIPYQIIPELSLAHLIDVPKVLILTDPADEARIYDEFARRYGHELSVSRSLPGYIEINKFGVDKGSALADLAMSMGISQEETAAAGDSYLDLGMIEWAGFGVSVANAVPCIREAANVHCPSAIDDGVAWFIEKYILEEN